MANTEARLTLGQSAKIALQAVHMLGPRDIKYFPRWHVQYRSLEEQLAARNSSIPIVELADSLTGRDAQLKSLKGHLSLASDAAATYLNHRPSMPLHQCYCLASFFLETTVCLVEGVVS